MSRWFGNTDSSILMIKEPYGHPSPNNISPTIHKFVVNLWTELVCNIGRGRHQWIHTGWQNSYSQAWPLYIQTTFLCHGCFLQVIKSQILMRTRVFTSYSSINCNFSHGRDNNYRNLWGITERMRKKHAITAFFLFKD